jgi:glycosyltransferase involved in cell wall biosynthesis
MNSEKGGLGYLVKQTQPLNYDLGKGRGFQSTAQPKVSIVIPAYNEEEGLPIVLRNLIAVLDESYEIIVVDDGSNDRTSEVATSFPCRVIRHQVNRGKGEALKSAIAAAFGDNVLWIDADDTYPVDTIPQMVQALFDGADMVCGSRMLGRERMPAFNRFGNNIFCFLIRKLYGYGGKDPCTGLCALRKEALFKMDLHGSRFTIDSEIAMKAGRLRLKVVNFPIRYRERIGYSKLSGIRDGARILGGITRHLLWRPSKKIIRENEIPSPLAEKD